MVRQREGLTEIAPSTRGSGWQSEEISKAGGLWELGGESRTSEGLCRSRLD